MIYLLGSVQGINWSANSEIDPWKVDEQNMSSTTKDVKKKEFKKSVVDHTYRDYSRVEISDLVDDYKGVNDELFTSKLHMILSTPEYASFITWKPHGRAWTVVDKLKFTSIVLPKYFNHSNFNSFNRSVNGWGFKVVSVQPYKCFNFLLLCLLTFSNYCNVLVHAAPFEGRARPKIILP